MALSDKVWNDGEEGCHNMFYESDVECAVKNTLEDLECYMGHNVSSCIEIKKILKDNFGDAILGDSD